MYQTLLPGLRGLRASLLTGALAISSFYVLFADSFLKHIQLRPSAVELLNISPYMPIGLILLLCYLVGSLYTTALEGAVDWLHQKTVLIPLTQTPSSWRQWALLSISPFSVSARRRIEAESFRFFDEYSSEGLDDNASRTALRDRFVKDVVSELLWLEGKLVGTPLQAPYEQFRAEGELRLGTAILLPLVAAASTYATRTGRLYSSLIFLIACAIAIKLGDYGLYYFKRAHSFLAHHVSDGTILAPSMEGLKRIGKKELVEKIPTSPIAAPVVNQTQPS